MSSQPNYTFINKLINNTGSNRFTVVTNITDSSSISAIDCALVYNFSNPSTPIIYFNTGGELIIQPYAKCLIPNKLTFGTTSSASLSTNPPTPLLNPISQTGSNQWWISADNEFLLYKTASSSPYTYQILYNPIRNSDFVAYNTNKIYNTVTPPVNMTTFYANYCSDIQNVDKLICTITTPQNSTTNAVSSTNSVTSTTQKPIVSTTQTPISSTITPSSTPSVAPSSTPSATSTKPPVTTPQNSTTIPVTSTPIPSTSTQIPTTTKPPVTTPQTTFISTTPQVTLPVTTPQVTTLPVLPQAPYFLEIYTLYPYGVGSTTIYTTLQSAQTDAITVMGSGIFTGTYQQVIDANATSGNFNESNAITIDAYPHGNGTTISTTTTNAINIYGVKPTQAYINSVNTQYNFSIEILPWNSTMWSKYSGYNVASNSIFSGQWTVAYLNGTISTMLFTPSIDQDGYRTVLVSFPNNLSIQPYVYYIYNNQAYNPLGGTTLFGDFIILDTLTTGRMFIGGVYIGINSTTNTSGSLPTFPVNTYAGMWYYSATKSFIFLLPEPSNKTMVQLLGNVAGATITNGVVSYATGAEEIYKIVLTFTTSNMISVTNNGMYSNGLISPGNTQAYLFITNTTLNVITNGVAMQPLYIKYT